MRIYRRGVSLGIFDDECITPESVILPIKEDLILTFCIVVKEYQHRIEISGENFEYYLPYDTRVKAIKALKKINKFVEENFFKNPKAPNESSFG